jgi:hypothetical protein
VAGSQATTICRNILGKYEGRETTVGGVKKTAEKPGCDIAKLTQKASGDNHMMAELQSTGIPWEKMKSTAICQW